LRLLRCGATCHVTSRFVSDAALRFSLEPDYDEWRHNLQLYYLELCDLPSVEAFCALMLDTLPRLDILINNAAQTLTRPEQWTAGTTQHNTTTAFLAFPAYISQERAHIILGSQQESERASERACCLNEISNI
jgi:NAD(P)-dependent dehydrogenase (short-subunit alcohol dehydrogenase family)